MMVSVTGRTEQQRAVFGRRDLSVEDGGGGTQAGPLSLTGRGVVSKQTNKTNLMEEVGHKLVLYH